MIRISFDFDEITKSVSNVRVDATKQKSITAQSPNDLVHDEPDLVVLENKLQLSKNALNKLDARADDRIDIQYVSEGVGKSAPVIGKGEAFIDRLGGNRLTQKGTVSFRGEKRTTLLQFGTIFNLEEYKPGIWKLVPVKEEIEESESLSQEESDLNDLNNSEIEEEIQEVITSMEDDLPF